MHQWEITIVNFYVPNFDKPNIIKQTSLDLIDRSQHNDSGNINTPLSPINRSSRQKNQQRNFRIKWHHRPNGIK
jgi:hypothetical protein